MASMAIPVPCESRRETKDQVEAEGYSDAQRGILHASILLKLVAKNNVTEGRIVGPSH
jgi:hypothetical protein